MAHDWKNDWMKPGTPVKFTQSGQEITGTVGLVSYDAKQAIVRYKLTGDAPGSKPREVTLTREQLTRVEGQ